MLKANNNHYNFKLTGLSPDEVFLEALDKILPYINSRTVQTEKLSTPGIPEYNVVFDEKLKIWIAKETKDIINEKIMRVNSEMK